MSDPDGVRWRGVRLGVVWMVLAGLSFTLMVSLVKTARQELDFLDVVFWRGLVSLPFAMALAARVPWASPRPGLMTLRAMLGLGAMSCAFYAAKGLPITDQVVIGKLQPIVVAALAPILLGAGERAGRGGWLLIATGLLGTAILVAPEWQVGSWYGPAAFAATVFSGLAHLCVRRLTATDPPVRIVLWLQAGVTAVAGAALLAGPGLRLPPAHLAPALAGIGLLAVTGQWLMTHAYRLEPAPRVATAAYTSPLWAVILDAVAWGVLPGPHAIVGGAIVVGSGLALLRAR